MKNSSNYPNLARRRDTGNKSTIEPPLKLLSPIFVHNNLIVLHVVTNDEIWSKVRPLKTTELLF